MRVYVVLYQFYNDTEIDSMYIKKASAERRKRLMNERARSKCHRVEVHKLVARTHGVPRRKV